MSTIDKSIPLTDSIIDELLDDWFERDGETFLKIRKDGRLGWEKTLEAGDSYSSYLLEAPTQEDLIKRAYTLARETLVSMDLPFKVSVKISPGDTSSFTTGKLVCVSTSMFDDPELIVSEKLDTFLGVTIHEGCHLLYTDFEETSRIKLRVVYQIFNILEDERIEELCGERKPGLANFLEKSKYFYFDQYYLDYVVPKEKECTLTPFDRIMNCFLHIIRYPKYLREEEVIEFGHYLLAIKKVVVPYPVNTAETVDAANKIFEIIKEFYEDIERKSSESSEGDSSESPSELSVRSFKKLIEDATVSCDALEKISSSSPSFTGLKKSEVSKELLKEDGLLGEVCEGKTELGASVDSFFSKAPSSQEEYQKSLSMVKKYIPAISKIMKGYFKEYKLIHRSMRSGVLDTNKLAEAFQGVPTVYLREGEVKTDKVSVCVLIDESGSMHGERIQAARNAAILINEAIGSVPNVELFIYGHSGDIRKTPATELFVYREKGYSPKYSLGSVTARYENRDGIAILETAKRVRNQTKNPVLFFILSDGSPAAYSYGGDSAMRHVKDCVDKVERLGFYVIQVCIKHSYDPGRMFRHYVVMEDMNTLAIELGKTIKKATMTAAKVSIV